MHKCDIMDLTWHIFSFNHHALAGETRAGAEGEGQEGEETASPDLPRAKPFEK